MSYDCRKGSGIVLCHPNQPKIVYLSSLHEQTEDKLAVTGVCL